MLDLLFKGAVALATVAVAVGAIVAVGYAFNAWRNTYRDRVTSWIHAHCKNEQFRNIILKAVCIFDAHVAGNVNKMVRWVIKAKRQNGSEVQIETSDVSIDVAKGAGCIVNDNNLDTSEKVLFNESETATMQAYAAAAQLETREVSLNDAKMAGCNINNNILDASNDESFNDEEMAALLGIC